MVDTAAFMKQYRTEGIAAFEQRYSMLRVGCTQEVVISGNTAEFLVTDSNNGTQKTRGPNGKIPYISTGNTQYTCTLVEGHGPYERTGFNIFSSQGNQKQSMLRESVGVLNRGIDDAIITQLDTATNDTGDYTTASMDMVVKAQVILGNNNVELEDEDSIFAAITPAFRAYLQQTTEFSSGDYVTVKPLEGPPRKMFRWNGVNWMVSTRLTGVGTAAEKCYMWHKNAIGHAANAADMDIVPGYDSKQDTSWVRSTLFHGSKLLQNSGIVQMKHDGAAYAAS